MASILLYLGEMDCIGDLIDRVGVLTVEIQETLLQIS